MTAKPLTPKQARFVEEYLVDQNATQAYIRAGYAEKGARGHAARLVANGSIRAAIAERQAARSERVQIDQDAVIRRLLREADMGVEEDDKANSARIRAIELLGRHLGMFVERHEHAYKPIDQWTEEECDAFLRREPEALETRH